MRFHLEEINVSDFEARGDTWNEIIYCGIIYKEGYYEAFSVAETLDFFIANPGIYFFHNGGRYDFIFILGELQRRKIKASLIATGSSIISLQFEKTELRDSLFILPNKLEILAQKFAGKGKEKLGKTKAERIIRCKEDCRLLKLVIEKHREYLQAQFHTDIKLTLAMTGLSALKSVYNYKFRRQSPWNIELLRSSFFGGRCEIYRFTGQDINCYDVNSMYPFCSTKTLPSPFSAPAIVSKLKDKYLDKPIFIKGEFNVKKQYLPQLPFRKDKKIYFPYGKISGLYAYPDLRYSLENENITINKIEKVILFPPSDFLADFMVKMYEQRRASENESEKYILKILMNSIFGKFAQRLEKLSVITNPSLMEIAEGNLKPYIDNKDTGIFIKQGKIYIPDFIQPQVSAYITAYSRELLYQNMYPQMDKIYYCDTDSIYTSGNMETSDRLGDFKLEKKCDNVEFWLPKIYKLNFENAIIEKAKGFGKMEGIYDKLKEKKKIFDNSLNPKNEAGILYNDGIYGFKTCIRRGLKFGTRKNVMKQIKSDYDKRRIIGNETEPFSIDEILA